MEFWQVLLRRIAWMKIINRNKVKLTDNSTKTTLIYEEKCK